MKYGSSALFPIVILLLLAAMTFWLERATQAEATSPAAKRHDPDYIVDNFTVKRFDADGKLQHTLVAKHMQHYPDDDSTDVTQPFVTYHRNRPTLASSDTARMNADGKEVKLQGNVLIVHKNINNHPDTEIRTSEMYVYPDDELARSKVPVVITQGKTVIHGSGLEASNKTKIGVLFGRVQGTIEPHSK